MGTFDSSSFGSEGEGLQKADPTLRDSLRGADEDHDIEVACVVTAMESEQKAQSPEQFALFAHEVVRRAEEAVGFPATRVNVLENIHALVLAAKPRFIKALLSQAEISYAMASAQPHDLQIRPE